MNRHYWFDFESNIEINGTTMLINTLLLSAMLMTNSPEPRFLALGDSYTIGEGVDANQRWPVQLCERLRSAGQAIGDPEIIARTGWTTDELLTAIDEASPRPPYALVSVLIGVNDQYRGYSAAQYRIAFTKLLQRAIALAADQPDHVLVLSIPDWGVTAFGANSGRDLAQVAREIDVYNKINYEISIKNKVHYMNITQATRTAGAKPEWLTTDGLHPSALLYKQWIDLVLPQAHAVLAEH